MRRRDFAKLFLLAPALEAVLRPAFAQQNEVRLATSCITADYTENRLERCTQKIIKAIRAAAAAGVDVLVLPELMLGGYTANNLNKPDEWWRAAIQSGEYQAAESVIAETVKDCGVHLLIGMAMLEGEALFDVSMHLSPSGDKTLVHKKHTALSMAPSFTAAAFDFKEFRLPGIESVQAAPVICAELSNEQVKQALWNLPASLLIHQAAIGGLPSELYEKHYTWWAQHKGAVVLANSRILGYPSFCLLKGRHQPGFYYFEPDDALLAATLSGQSMQFQAPQVIKLSAD